MVDAPKQGYGNTNDGNTARTFFNPKNLDVVAEITGKIKFTLIGILHLKKIVEKIRILE